MLSTNTHPPLASCKMMHLCVPFRSAILLLLLPLFLPTSTLSQDLTLSAITPSISSSPTGVPNTFIGAVGSQIASSLLASGTPALLWAVVPSDSINAACQLIVNTGTHTITASVNDEWGGGSEQLTLQLVATGGCLAASDASGTEFVFADNFGRTSAIVCPSNAGSSGCAVFMTGDDITAFYSSGGGSKRKLLALVPGRKMLDCSAQGAAIGGLIGLGTGALTALGCGYLTVYAPFCLAGVLGIEIIFGALGGSGCIPTTSCFPGDAMVQTVDGLMKPMFELALGDKVAVLSHVKKAIVYEDVYAFGHKDSNAITTFFEIGMAPVFSNLQSHSKTLQLTGLHFVPTSADVRGHVFFKRAQDIRVGDLVWGTNHSDHRFAGDQENQVAVPYRVTEISSTWKLGLYNPFTLSGMIVVDGVAASVHSDWFLDKTFDTLGLSHWLPATYQFVLLPIRTLYLVLGKNRYVCIYNWLDASLDVATFGTHYGGIVTFGVVSSLIAVTIAAAFKSMTWVKFGGTSCESTQ